MLLISIFLEILFSLSSSHSLSTPKPTQLSSLSYDSESQSIFLYGGFEEFSEYNDKLWRFDLSSSSWSSLSFSSDLNPGPRVHPYITFYPSSTSLLLYGGTTPRGPISDIWTLDMPSLQVTFSQWSLHDSMNFNPPPTFLSAVCSYWHKDRFYLASAAGMGRKGILNRLFILDVKTLIWSEPKVSGDILPNVYGAEMVHYEDALYFYGGKFDDHRSMNDIYRLDIESYTWSKIDVGTSKPPGLFSFGCVVHEDYLYLIHGYIYEHHEHETGLWRVNLKNDEKVWEHYYFASQDEVVQLDRDSFGLARNLDKVYLFGGRTMKGLQNDLLELDLHSSIYSWDNLSKSTVKPYHSRVASEILSNYTNFEEIPKVKSTSQESIRRNDKESIAKDKYNQPKLDEISSYSHTRLLKSSLIQEFLYSLMYGAGVGFVIGIIMLCYSILKLKYLYSSDKVTHKKIYSLDDVDIHLFLKAFQKRKALTNRRHSIG